MLKKIPVPIAGVMLGTAALGNLLQSYSEGVRVFCGLLSAVFGLLFILKVVCYPKQVAEDMKNPIMASISATFPMGCMLLAGYLKPVIGKPADMIWYVAIGLHVLLILYFTWKFLLHLRMEQVFASYFIVYVGIVVASVSAPVFGRQDIGMAAFWFGFVSVLILLVLVSVRYISKKNIPEPAKPLFCIYTAPVSLCLAGYVQSAQEKSAAMVIFLAVLGAVLYVLVLIKLPSFLRLKFYPSYAAFTVPFVITAIGLKMAAGCLAGMGDHFSWLSWIVTVETVIAVLLVVYTIVCYAKFIVGTGNKR